MPLRGGVPDSKVADAMSCVLVVRVKNTSEAQTVPAARRTANCDHRVAIVEEEAALQSAAIMA